MDGRGRQLQTSVARRLGTLASLYVAQGITWGLVSALLIPWFAGQGMPLHEQAGIFVVGTLPWAIKMAWAPLLDRFGGMGSGNQRRWIMAGQTLMALCVMGMGLYEKPFEQAGAIAALWFLHNLFMSLQDVATDALAIDILDEHERGRANAFMLGGHALGAFLGSFVLGKVMASTGLPTAILLDGLVVLLLVPVVLLVRRDDLSSDAVTQAPLGPRIRAAFARPGAWVGLGLAVVVLVADSALSAVSQNFLVVELGYPMEKLYAELVPVELAVQLLAFAATAVVIERMGHLRTAGVGALLLAAVWTGFVALQSQWSSFGFIVGFTVVQALCMPPFKSGIHAFLMDLTDPSVRAMQFAVFMAALNLGRSAGGWISAPVVERMGYPGLFLTAAGVQVVVGAAIFAVGRWARGRR